MILLINNNFMIQIQIETDICLLNVIQSLCFSNLKKKNNNNNQIWYPNHLNWYVIQ